LLFPSALLRPVKTNSALTAHAQGIDNKFTAAGSHESVVGRVWGLHLLLPTVANQLPAWHKQYCQVQQHSLAGPAFTR
jgi:hypothetical protein